MDNIDFVKNGYREVVDEYRATKDESQAQIPIFEKWLDKIDNALELGCATGYPIGKEILERGKKYTGIDLSPEHIAIARKTYPQWSDHFIEGEMLSFVKSQPDHNYSGVVSMFSIRHLPRINHVELFYNIKRILKSGGHFLVDLPQYSDDGRDSWFNGKPMYWSSFSEEWSKLTLKELGFFLLEEFLDVRIFDGVEEKTKFVLYRT
jgi:SAM-dependent methyltransferase